MTQISEVWGLQNALDNKAEESHQHRIAEVDGLKGALASRADVEHEHQLASEEEAGFMSAADKTKLDALQTSGGPSETLLSSVQGLTEALDSKAANAAVEELETELVGAIAAGVASRAAANHGHNAATTSAAGFMSAADKQQLSALAQNAAVHSDLQALQVEINDRAPLNHSHNAATTNAAGFMSAADKQKLDSLSGGSGINMQIQPFTYSVTQSSVFGSTTSASYERLTDGNLSTGAATNASANEWIRFDLGAVRLIQKLSFAGGSIPNWGSTAAYLNGAILEVSIDSAEWQVLNDSISLIIDTAPTFFATGIVAARYLRLRSTAKTSNYLALTEFRAFG